jgi:hypothetical protein
VKGRRLNFIPHISCIDIETIVFYYSTKLNSECRLSFIKTVELLLKLLLFYGYNSSSGCEEGERLGFSNHSNHIGTPGVATDHSGSEANDSQVINVYMTYLLLE